MKAYFLALGAGAERGLPSILTAMSCGAARQASAVDLTRIPLSGPNQLTDRMMADLDFCRRMFAAEKEFPFFRAEWTSALWRPELPGRDLLVRNEESRLLLQALRGEGIPFSFRTDREAAEWSASSLLEALPEDPEELAAVPDENLKTFALLLSRIHRDLAAGEDVRVMLLCDLAEDGAVGLALSLIRFLRARFAESAPFIGLIGEIRAFGPAAEDRVTAARDVLSALRARNLVRLSEERDTAGADALWLLGLPSSMMTGEDSCRLQDWAAARILGEVWTAPARPAAGLHTREISGVLTLQALDEEARPAAAFLRGAFWSLSDLFPALRSYLDHPALLRSLAPATRGGLFRKLFRDGGDPENTLKTLDALERTLRALCLEILSLIRTLPPVLREADPSTDLWQRAVQACGQTVTLSSEYDVRRGEAEESGVDRVQPVHRVSMDDTAEEEMIRRLDNMAAELSGSQARREEIFREGGGFTARLAMEDCLAKCRVALVSAREKLALMPSDTPEERYAMAVQERRTRMLDAAVRRSEEDLAALKAWDALSRPASLRPSAPFAGEILDPALAEKAFTMLTAEGDEAAAAARETRDGLTGLLKGTALNDAKILLKNLISACRQPDPEAPLRSLMTCVFSVCGVEVSGLNFRSAGQYPAVPLLPDLTEEGRFFSPASAPDRVIAKTPADRTAEIRGLLALMILRQYRRRGPEDAALELIPLQPEDSPLTRVYLSSRNVSRATLCALRAGEGEEVRRQPLAVILPGTGLESARLRASGADLIPSFAFWLDRETLTFRDPCPYLSEGDRRILTEQLTRLRAAMNTAEVSAVTDFLSDWHQDIIQIPRRMEDGSDLRSRLRVAALTRLPVWQKDLRRLPAYYESSLTDDPVCAALCGEEAFPPVEGTIREDVLYVFRDVPIARESPDRLLEGTRAPGEAHYLSSLNTECDILFHSSDDYHEALAASLQEMTLRFPSADPDALAECASLLEEAREPVTETITELTWPWDTYSASVLTILTECLGPDLAPSALGAFSGRLTLFPARGGEILGDVMLGGMCVLPRGGTDAPAETPEPESTGEPVPPESAEDSRVRPDAVLPPLSADFARALCRSPQGQSLITPNFLRFSAEGASVRAEMTLEGAFTLKLTRVYAPEEILTFYSHDLPTLALWPSLPFAPEDWHAYHSCAHCGADFGVTAVSRTEETPLTGSAPRFAACQAEFPLCYLITWQDREIGAVPNLLPVPDLPESGDWAACLDFGAAASSVVFTDGANRWPLQGPVTVRTLLRSPAATSDVLWREFLPAVPVSAILPGALRVFRNDLTEADLPLRDGAVFMSSSLRDVLDVPSDTLYTDLKWNGEKGRAQGLYLHQVMLMSALEARCGGARTLRWRAALPEEMAPEGRERLTEVFLALAAEVSRESGLPLPEKEPPVVFTSESTALGAYFRLCAPEETRGGFMTLDLGADTADLSLYLQGRGDAVRCCQIPMGVHNMFLPSLLRRPALLQEDFGFVEDPAFRQDLADLQALLDRARRDPPALRQARYGLDAIIADHLPVFLDALSRRGADGAPGRTSALFLLHTSFLMTLCGLMLLQIAGDSQRNDVLPDTMTLFLAGRGNMLTEALSPRAKTSLWKMLTMFRNPRVRSVSLIFSAEKKLEIPVGLSVADGLTAALPRPAPSPAAVAVRPEELMPEFLLRFRREFPAEAALLFPGVYADDYFAPFTPYGQDLLTQALQAAFDRPDSPRPFRALVSCLSHLLDMIQEGTF